MSLSLFFNRTTDEPRFGVIVPALFILILLIVVGFNSCTYVNPGYVGVLVNKMGGGVSPHPLGNSLHFQVPFAQEIDEYPISMRTLVLTKTPTEGSPNDDSINVNSIEGQPVSCDVSLSFELDPMKVPELYKAFRTDIDTIAHGFVKQTIRQAL